MFDAGRRLVQTEAQSQRRLRITRNRSRAARRTGDVEGRAYEVWGARSQFGDRHRAEIMNFGVAISATFGLASHAANLVTNGSFESTTLMDKGSFFGNVAGWSGGTNLTFLDFPGTADDLNKYLAVYGPFPATSPDGGNFVEGDGDPNYSGAIYQTITGLTVGDKYQVSFYQAAGQQAGFTGPTTEQWAVSLGGTTQLSSLFSLAQGGVGPWEKQTMTFTADGTSDVLTFLAEGTPGGAPPISFLDGVTLNAVPEPGAWALMMLGVTGLGATMRRRRVALAA
jgi:hypothetical protein